MSYTIKKQNWIVVPKTNFNLSSFKWKTAICNQGRPYFCTARAPRCPPGYTWIASIVSSCFKITELKGSRVGSQTVNAEPSFHKACAQEGTRLASIKTSAEKTALFEWAFGSEFTNDKNVRILSCVHLTLSKFEEWRICSSAPF